MSDHLVGFIPIGECPESPGQHHLLAVRMSWWPEGAVTDVKVSGLPPDTPVDWFHHCEPTVDPS